MVILLLKNDWSKLAFNSLPLKLDKAQTSEILRHFKVKVVFFFRVVKQHWSGTKLCIISKVFWSAKCWLKKAQNSLVSVRLIEAENLDYLTPLPSFRSKAHKVNLEILPYIWARFALNWAMKPSLPASIF